MAHVDDAGRDLLMFLVGSVDEAEQDARERGDAGALARAAADRELLGVKHGAISIGGITGCAWCTTAEAVAPWPCDVITGMARRYSHPHYGVLLRVLGTVSVSFPGAARPTG